MGRLLKRVPLDFNYPIKQTWKGYLNPYSSIECKSCGGSCLNKETKQLSDDWYSFDKSEWVYLRNGNRFNDKAWQYHLTEIEIKELVKQGRLSDLMKVRCHFCEDENKWFGWIDGIKQEIEEPEYPVPETVNEWAKIGFGHDSCNQWIAVEARARHLGFYGKCPVCKGEGVIWYSDEIKKLQEEWLPYEPPTGEGYQLWENTSEGSAVSPVFETLDGLCEWCEENATTFGSSKTSREHWKEMLDDNFVCHKIGNAIFI